MRYLNPSMGEICDRVVILQKKVTEFQKKGLSTKHLEAELDPLLMLSLAKQVQLLDEDKLIFNELMIEINKVNMELWDLEDRIRMLSKNREDGMKQGQIFFVSDVMDTAFAIPEKNDLRAELVRQINILFGDGSSEKIYGA